MTKVMTLICERSCDLSDHLDDKDQVKGVPGCYVLKFPCSGMIQPLMIEAALKNGADGVVVTGCQLGDCYYREGNKMIRDRLLGNRPPGLKKTVDRRRVLGLWLSKVQPQKFISEVKEFIKELNRLGPQPAAPAPAAAKPAPAKPAGGKPTSPASQTPPPGESSPAASAETTKPAANEAPVSVETAPAPATPVELKPAAPVEVQPASVAEITPAESKPVAEVKPEGEAKPTAETQPPAAEQSSAPADNSAKVDQAAPVDKPAAAGPTAALDQPVAESAAQGTTVESSGAPKPEDGTESIGESKAGESERKTEPPSSEG